MSFSSEPLPARLRGALRDDLPRSPRSVHLMSVGGLREGLWASAVATGISLLATYRFADGGVDAIGTAAGAIYMWFAVGTSLLRYIKARGIVRSGHWECGEVSHVADSRWPLFSVRTGSGEYHFERLLTGNLEAGESVNLVVDPRCQIAAALVADTVVVTRPRLPVRIAMLAISTVVGVGLLLLIASWM